MTNKPPLHIRIYSAKITESDGWVWYARFIDESDDPEESIKNVREKAKNLPDRCNAKYELCTYDEFYNGNKISMRPYNDAAD